MDSYIILAQAEARIRRLEADVRQLKCIEELRLLGAEQQRVFSTTTITVVTAMAVLGLFYFLLLRMG